MTRSSSKVAHRAELRPGRLGLTFILAFAAVSAYFVVSQTLVQNWLGRLAVDAHLLRLGGEQVASCQRVAALSQAALEATSPEARTARLAELRTETANWERGQRTLQFGSADGEVPPVASEALRARFQRVSPFFGDVLKSVRDLLVSSEAAHADGVSFDATTARLAGPAGEIEARAPLYVMHMDDLVRRMEVEATSRVADLTRTQWFLTAITIVAMAILCFLFVRPTVVKLRRTILHLRKAKQSASQAATRLRETNAELEMANERLSETARLAVESSRAKSDFVANMSHEIRTPMNAVIGMTDLLLDTSLDDEQRDYAETVKSSAEALLSLINDILDFSKIEARALELECVDFDLGACVEKAIELLASKAQAKSIELGALIEPDVPLRVRGDPMRLRQVLVNLVNNAVKFTERGEVSVTVSLEADLGDHVDLRVEVTDTGIGIPQDVLGRLFEAFTQADTSTTRRYGGTGLGLAISKQLVELMDGRIGVESEVGEGSTFWFTIVLAKREEAEERVAPEELAGRRALVVDEHENGRRRLARQLGAWDIVVDAVETSEEAGRRVGQARGAGQPYDFVLVDERIGERDGVAVIRALRDLDGGAQLAIVLLAAIGRRELLREAREAGANAVLSKPVRRARLRACLCELGPGTDVAVEESGVDAGTDADASDDASSGGVPASAPSAEEPARGARPSTPRSACRLLLAEDNKVNQKVALRMLQKLGFDDVTVVENGRLAVDACAASDFAAILMDCQMPVMSGYDAAREIRALDGPRGRTPVIAMTANAMQGDRERALSAGMNDYVCKPVSREHLEEVLMRWIDDDRTDTEDAEASPPTTAESSALPEDVVDDAVIDQLRSLADEDDPDVLAELVEAFNDDMPVRLEEIRAAIRDGDAPALEMAAHTLKSASGNMGAARVNELSRRLEECGRNRDLSPTPGLLTQLEAEASRAANALGELAVEPQ